MEENNVEEAKVEEVTPETPVVESPDTGAVEVTAPVAG